MIRIPFTSRMLGEILIGRKTQTRRLGARKLVPGDWVLVATQYAKPMDDPYPLNPAQYWQCRATMEGMVLAAVKLAGHDRDTHAELAGRLAHALVADAAAVGHSVVVTPPNMRGMPARYMPTWLCPAALQVVDVSDQVLGNISEYDARAEGFSTRAEFVQYWESLHPNTGLEVEVQALEFKAYGMREALAQPGMAELALPIKADWPEAWNAYLPDWLKARFSTGGK